MIQATEILHAGIGEFLDRCATEIIGTKSLPLFHLCVLDQVGCKRVMSCSADQELAMISQALLRWSDPQTAEKLANITGQATTGPSDDAQLVARALEPLTGALHRTLVENYGGRFGFCLMILSSPFRAPCDLSIAHSLPPEAWQEQFEGMLSGGELPPATPKH